METENVMYFSMFLLVPVAPSRTDAVTHRPINAERITPALSMPMVTFTSLAPHPDEWVFQANFDKLKIDEKAGVLSS